ncbi:DUF4880 domain-containing protein [Pigmentiphaga aceris]|uniref:DUF4880 domain-containing protein n=1 Tax=Pigmentiphaga aceris TaxID=1940612 RepID=A0A5C0ASC8_9BURK|nr:FecR domain-containing protein [Pigmentiphaga aceris]QEI05149.1 DUF4880 domain-containing protein [Pigmentiphaga aceris]
MSAAHSNIQGLNERVALQAAQWFFLLNSGDATATERHRCAQWRAADPVHEIAWQRAERINQTFQMLPGDLAMPALGRQARTDRRAVIKTLAVLLVAAPVGWQGWRLASGHPWLADHRTQTGERRELRLPDGTRLTLNTASAVDVAYDGTRRLLRLRAGEILIDTAPDSVAANHPAYRPFMVETPAGMLRALGTRFVVRRLDDDVSAKLPGLNGSAAHAYSEVAVLDGAVEIRPAANADRVLVLRAGQQTAFTDIAVEAPGVLSPQVDDWARGILRATDMRLADFLTELGRYRPGVLRCDPAVADLKISGVFQLRDTGPVLDSLPQALPVSVHYRTRYWVTVGAPEG